MCFTHVLRPRGFKSTFFLLFCDLGGQKCNKTLVKNVLWEPPEGPSISGAPWGHPPLGLGFECFFYVFYNGLADLPAGGSLGGG